MDDRLAQALETSKFLSTLHNQKRILQEQFKNNLKFYYNGGQFTVSQTLISFVSTLISCNQESVILVDDHSIPVSIEDLNKFLRDILDVYFTASNKFLTDYNAIRTKRSVKGLIDD